MDAAMICSKGGWGVQSDQLDGQAAAPPSGGADSGTQVASRCGGQGTTSCNLLAVRHPPSFSPR